MRLQSRLTVAAELEPTWARLLDIGLVARCVPGAALTSDGTDGIHRGALRAELWPVIEYEGVAQLLEVDEDRHVSTIEVRGREANGRGTATATIRNRVSRTGHGRTRIELDAELHVSGQSVQLDRGVLEEAAGKMLAEFAARLEAQVLTGEAEAESAPTPPLHGVPADRSPVSRRAVRSLVCAGAVLVGAVWLFARTRHGWAAPMGFGRRRRSR